MELQQDPEITSKFIPKRIEKETQTDICIPNHHYLQWPKDRKKKKKNYVSINK